MSLLGRLREGLTRTKQQIVDRFDTIVSGADAPERRSRAIDVETLDALEELLISADLGLPATSRIIADVKAQPRNGASLRNIVKNEIRRVFDDAERPIDVDHHPRVVLVVGVNGTGKTTTVGKLANLFKAEGQRPLICAADTSDPAAVVFDAIESGKARARDPILVDTAGRLHTRTNLMQELDKIRRVASREVPGAPHDVLLVLDATVGQNGVAQAREFMGVAGVNGIVLTKLDGTAKGGVAVAIAHDLKLPIRYVGIGEGIDDLVPFSAEEYVSGLFEQRW